MGPVIIATERVELRGWTSDDAESFASVARDPLVVEFITGGRPLEEAEIREFVSRQIDLQDVRGWCRWAMHLRMPEEDEPAGVVGFCGPGCTFAPDIEIGWWLRSDLWGRGLATEAARGAVAYCFEVVGFDRLVSAILPENTRSIRVAEKVGFALEGEFTHAGLLHSRYALENPNPPAVHDPRFRRDCVGAPSGSVVRIDGPGCDRR